MQSPLSDPLVSALFTHHRDLAPDDLIARLVPLDVRSAKEKRQAQERAKVAVLPVSPLKTGFTEYERRFPGGLAPYPSVKLIIARVANFYGVRIHDIIANRRTRDIIKPRQVAMFLCYELTPRSLPAIGKQIGDRDHTTILHGVRKIKELLQTDERLADEIEVIKLHITQIMLEAA